MELMDIYQGMHLQQADCQVRERVLVCLSLLLE